MERDFLVICNNFKKALEDVGAAFGITTKHGAELLFYVGYNSFYNNRY